MKNLRPRRHQEDREKGVGSKSYLSEPDGAGSNEENDKNEMGALYREMEDWYREEENHSMARAV